MRGLVRPVVFLPVLMLLCGAVSFWYASRGVPFSDEGAVLTAAAKILRGGVFYRDIDAYWYPGAAYLLAFWMSLLGEHLSVARGLAAVMYCAMAGSLYLTSLRLMDPGRAALFGLSLICLKLLGWPAFSTYLYSDVAFAFGCAAIALLVSAPEGRAPRWIGAAGFCVGLSLVSKQNLGIYLALASQFVLWRRAGREWLPFAAGLALPVGGMAAGFAADGLLGPMLYSGLVRPFTGYLSTSGIPFTPMLAWWELGSLRGPAAAPYFVLDYFHMLMKGWLPGESLVSFWWTAGEILSRLIYTAVPVAFTWALARGWAERGRPQGPHGEALLRYAPLALAGVLSAFPRADMFHVVSVFPLVALLLFALAQPKPGARAKPPWIEGVAVASLLLASTGLAVAHRGHLDYRMALARAEVWIDPADAWIEPLVETVMQELAPEERLFVYGHESHFYFLTGRFYPWPFSQLYPGQAGADGGRRLAALLVEKTPALVIRGLTDWPGVPRLPSYAPLLEERIEARFREDPDFFTDHPVPTGGEEPLSWVLRVLRPRASTR